jgi:hypothetical protein
MFGHADRTHTGTTAAMGDAESLVEIQMQNIRAKLAGSGDAYQRVHIRAIHIHLAAMIVDDFADFTHRFFIDAVCRWVGDHQGREVLGVLFGFGSQVIDINITVVVGGDDNHFHSSHGGAGRVGAMGAGRNQANMALALHRGRSGRRGSPACPCIHPGLRNWVGASRRQSR